MTAVPKLPDDWYQIFLAAMDLNAAGLSLAALYGLRRGPGSIKAKDAAFAMARVDEALARFGLKVVPVEDGLASHFSAVVSRQEEVRDPDLGGGRMDEALANALSNETLGTR